MTDSERRLALESMFDTDGWSQCYVPSIQKRRESLVLQLINDDKLNDQQKNIMTGTIRALDSLLRVAKEVELMKTYLNDEQAS